MITKELIEEAKGYLKKWTVTPASCRDECEKTILDALEAAERELAEYKRKAITSACPECTAMKAMKMAAWIERALPFVKAEHELYKNLTAPPLAGCDPFSSKDERREAIQKRKTLTILLDEWDARMDATNR